MGGWIPLVDYAVKNGVSLSTLRRHIKAEKIRYQRAGGKYLLWDEDEKQAPARAPTPAPMPSPSAPQAQAAPTADVSTLLKRVDRMERALKSAQEEIAELKMLVALYEERMPENMDN